MHRKKLTHLLRNAGWKLYRHGGNHDIWINSKGSQKETIPRHSVLNKYLAKAIIKQCHLK